MKNLLLSSLLVGSIVFTGCSSKKVFEPEDTSADWDRYESIDDTLADTTLSAAMLDDRRILDEKKILDIKVDEGYRLIGKTDGWIVSATTNGVMKLQDIEDATYTKIFDLKKTIASVGIKDDLLAVLFADNEIGLYTLSNQELLMKEQVGDAIAIDARIQSPYFVGGVVIFPTLDGKVVIVNPVTKKRLRTTIVSSAENFNNVLYFQLVGQKIIAATAHKILAMDQQERREKYEIRNVAYNGEDIYIATKQGELIALTPNLQLKAKLKFPFAHFLGLITKNDKVYALEKEGYMIVAPKDLSSHTIHDVDLDEGFLFVSEKGFVVNDEIILVE